MRTAGTFLLTCGIALVTGCSPAPSGASKAGGTVLSSATVLASSAAPNQRSAPPVETVRDANADMLGTVAAAPERDAEKRGPPDIKLIEREVADALKRASGCPAEARWKGWTIPVKITVSKNGHCTVDIGYVTISRPDDDFETLKARPQTECITAHFEMISVPPFDGESVVLERKLKMR